MGRLAWIAVAATLATAPALAQNPNVVKVPCRDMGDGRTLIDSSYLPSWFVMGTSTYDIIKVEPASTQGEWANRVCTIRITR